MATCRESRLLTDILPPSITIGVRNAQGTPVTITRNGSTGVLYYRGDWNSGDPKDDLSVFPSYTSPSDASKTYTDTANLAYIIYARTWGLDLDGIAHWSPLTTYPETP